MKAFLKNTLLYISILLLITGCSKDEKVATFELSTSSSPQIGGTILPSAGTYNSGDDVTLTATANDGYLFKNWSGDASGAENQLELKINTDKVIVANFEIADAYSEVYDIEGKTFIPDDGFEQLLINQGVDDVLDNYVITSSINTIPTLNIPSKGPGDSPVVTQFKGLEDFIGLERLIIDGNMTYDSSFDLTNNIKLKTFEVSCAIVDGLDLSKNLDLERFGIEGNNEGCNASLKNMNFSANTKLMSFKVDGVFIDDLNALLATVPNIEGFYGGSEVSSPLDLSRNSKLKLLFLISETGVPDKINFRNGNNTILESFQVSGPTSLNPICISANDPAYIESIINTNVPYSVVLDCGF